MKQPLVNTFGAFGYSSVLVQYLWTIITIGMPILTHETTKQLFLPNEPAEPREPVDPIVLPEFVEQLVIIGSIVFAIVIIVYAMIAVPRGIGRVGHAITKSTATKVAPKLHHHAQPVSKKRERRYISRFIWALKYTAATIPAALLFVPVDPSLGMEQNVVIVAGLIVYASSLLWFTLQATLARLWHIGARDVW